MYATLTNSEAQYQVLADSIPQFVFAACPDGAIYFAVSLILVKNDNIEIIIIIDNYEESKAVGLRWQDSKWLLLDRIYTSWPSKGSRKVVDYSHYHWYNQ